MPNLTQLRLAARKIFSEALRAADAHQAVRRAIQIEPSQMEICDVALDVPKNKSIFAIAIGKAGLPMAIALEEMLGDKLAGGVVSSSAPIRRSDPNQQINLSAGWQVFQGGHPEPNEESLSAARACFDLLERANDERATVIFLI